MRRFKFRLETVLRHRETIESLREQDFQKVQGQLRTIEARIAEYTEEYRQTVAGRPGNAQGERVNAQAILDRERYLLTLQATIAREERNADVVRLVLEEVRTALVEARRNREIVSRMRDKDVMQHTALMLKMAQDAMDELATLRHKPGSKM